MKYVLLSLILFCVFIPMLSGEFQFDDHFNITQEEGHGLNGHRVIQGFINSTIFKLVDTSTVPYHLVSLAFHIGVCCVLVAICEHMGYKPWAVALFAIHPVIGGAVSYIIQASVMMATFFCLLAFFMYLRKRYIWCALSWVVACFCKEIAWQFPLVIFAWEWSANKRNPYYLGTVIVGEIAGVCYMFITGAWNSTSLHFNMAERVATQGRVLFSYWGKILLPHTGNLTINGDTVVTGNLFTMYLFVFICLVLFMRSNRIWAFAVLCFCFLSVMESTIVRLQLEYEHRIYMPLAFMVPAFTSLRVNRRVFVGLFTWYLVLCLWYQGLWRSEYKMWRHAVQLTPNCPRANLNMARHLFNRREFDEALVYYRRTLECYPKHEGVWKTWVRHDLREYGNVFLMDTYRFIQYAGKHKGR